ncbi:MAG: uracil-DNA glycosylase family protein [Gammaproteobacteria bacterium]
MNLSAQQQQYLSAMGIQLWISNEADGEASVDAMSEVVPEVSQSAAVIWAELEDKVKGCVACGLDKTRKNTVFGVGNRQAEIMFVGEAPGQQEDLKGEPFVGRAGQLLNAMLQAIDVKREDVFISNILKCRPPNNRDPLPDEVKHCTDFLVRQIDLIQPKIICALGRVAGQYLLDTQLPLGKLRNRVHQYRKTRTPLVVMYHPAYLLRTPSAKRKAYEDLLLMKRQLKG